MEPLHIAICEDLPGDLELLAKRIHAARVPVKIAAFPSGEEMLKNFKPGLYHLIYLDIYMGELTGMQTAASLRELDERVLLAFTTTSKSHAFEANKYHSLLYIEKPVTQADIDHTLEMADARRERFKNQILRVPTEKKLLELRYEDIVMVEVLDQRCSILLKNGAEVLASTNVNIDDLEAALPQPPFLRASRSFIVNMDHVEDLGKDFTMRGGRTAYITQKNYEQISTAYEEYTFEKVREEV